MSLVQKHFFTFFAKWLYVLNLFSANQYFPKVVKSKMKIKKVNLFNLGSALFQIDDIEQLYSLDLCDLRFTGYEVHTMNYLL